MCYMWLCDSLWCFACVCLYKWIHMLLCDISAYDRRLTIVRNGWFAGSSNKTFRECDHTVSQSWHLPVHFYFFSRLWMTEPTLKRTNLQRQKSVHICRCPKYESFRSLICSSCYNDVNIWWLINVFQMSLLTLCFLHKYIFLTYSLFWQNVAMFTS